MDNLRLNAIVQRRGGAVQVDIADVRRRYARLVQRLVDGADRPFALRMWGGNMVRIAGFPRAQERNLARLDRKSVV